MTLNFTEPDCSGMLAAYTPKHKGVFTVNGSTLYHGSQGSSESPKSRANSNFHKMK